MNQKLYGGGCAFCDIKALRQKKKKKILVITPTSGW